MTIYKKMRDDKVSADKVRKIFRLIRGIDDPCMYARCDKWVRSCYNLPSKGERIIYAADEILETFGVEGFCDDDYQDGVLYCNNGDTYKRTLVLDHGKFRWCGWGDCVRD